MKVLFYFNFLIYKGGLNYDRALEFITNKFKRTCPLLENIYYLNATHTQSVHDMFDDRFRDIMGLPRKLKSIPNLMLRVYNQYKTDVSFKFQ